MKPLILLAFLGLSINTKAQNPGELDLTFDPGTGVTSPVYATAIQPDGKIIIGGHFNFYDETARSCIARLNADGTLDTSFTVGTGATGTNTGVRTTSIQPDGKIIIGGSFIYYNGTPRGRIARLNTDGSLDGSFAIGPGASDGVYGNIRTTTIQPDGKIIIGGQFTLYDGTSRNQIARLNTDGSLDLSFDPGTGANNGVLSTAIQPDGKIIIGGAFTSYNGTAINRIARLNSDGTLDASFTVGTGANNQVYTTSIQPDGKIIIGGAFTSYNGTASNYIARLNADGTLDNSFTVGTGANTGVLSTAIQPDGLIIIGGPFSSYNGTARGRIARLNADGSLDGSFTMVIGAILYEAWGAGEVETIAIQPDGKIIIGGNFISYDGTARGSIARLNGGEGAPVSVVEIGANILDLEVYPNPTNGRYNLMLGQLEGIISAKVFDAQGREVWSNSIVGNGTRSQHSIDLTDQAKGIYTLQLQSAQGTITRKLVKN